MSRNWRPGHARQRDANEPQIVRALLAAGYSVERVDVPCDLIVGRGRTTHLVEVKMPGEKLTPTQVRFQQTTRCCYHIATEPEALIDELRQCRAKGATGRG
jgi:hypothetical protein